MTTTVVLGDTLTAICSAHSILDKLPQENIHLVVEKAEMGLIGEGPGLYEEWPPCPPHWISDLASQAPTDDSTAVRRSWFEKSVGTELSRRGCVIHLRTRVTLVEEGQVHFVGAGPLGAASIDYDSLLDFRAQPEGEVEWSGAVCRTADAPPGEIRGDRSDGTTEIWKPGIMKAGGIWLQEMTWVGEDPRTALTRDIEHGISEACALADTIIQKPTRQ
ncbi:MAG: hypothetical protein CMA88_02290 [Euryarchaeota archaeon]|mgnify:CR=1 FL=1|nr:hypothetical protein [Euryarchaeota archaeon]